jgi:DNA-binding NtrC family response regulator
MTVPAPSTMTLLHGSERTVSFCAEVQDTAGTRLVPLPRGCFQVGAARHCAIVMDDATVSGEHLMLTVTPEHVVVRDTRSKNGTYVGAVRVREATAHAGAVVTLGRSTITLRVSGLHEDEVEDADPLPDLAGGSLAMRRVAFQVRRLAPLRFPVLVSGESGTGKELVAQALHALSPRKHKPFIAINVTSIPRELVESEFFGHERGSFTGAVSRRRGAFEDAEGGTLFLDEIGDLPTEVQPKLLRALDGYGVRSVGATGSAQRRDARVVAATHATLRDKVTAGEFRRDLFHRLEVFTIALPPLRDRRGDIGPIARTLLRSMLGDVGPKQLTSAALARLVSEPWPGNVRELRNALVRAASVAPGEVIESADVDAALGARAYPSGPPLEPILTPKLAHMLVREHRGNISAAARSAGCPRTTFRKVLAKRDDGE